MFWKKSKMIKISTAFVLIMALALTAVQQIPASAAKKISLSKKSVEIEV